MDTIQVPSATGSPAALAACALSRAQEAHARAATEYQSASPDLAPHCHARLTAARREVKILQEAVMALAGQGGTDDGEAGAPRPLPDTDGFDLRPDPFTARTPADLVACLRAYRAWAGQPSLRQIADRSGHVVSHTTVHAVLSAGALPGMRITVAIVAGCGGSQTDQQDFTTAWRRIAMGQF
jgi:hypothetical protein